MRTDENITIVKQLVQSDHKLTVRMISDELSLNRESVQTILLHDLGMQKVCAKWYPRFCWETRSRTESNFVKTCWKKLKMIQIFLGRSSQEMKFGFFNTIVKQRGKALSGRLQNHPDPIRHTCQNQKSRSC